MTYLERYCFLLKCHCSLLIDQCQTSTRCVHSEPRQRVIKLGLRCQRSFVAKLAQAFYSIQRCQACRRAGVVVGNLQSPVKWKKFAYEASVLSLFTVAFLNLIDHSLSLGKGNYDPDGVWKCDLSMHSFAILFLLTFSRDREIIAIIQDLNLTIFSKKLRSSMTLQEIAFDTHQESQHFCRWWSLGSLCYLCNISFQWHRLVLQF